MSEILCEWLNEDVVLSKKVDAKNILCVFANGYLFGEVLHRYGLQDDFTLFSDASSSEARLNNFTRIEPVLRLLNVKFDTNMANEIISEKPGMATRLLYQLFIALGKKTKMNLTGVAMETMRPMGPARLGVIESDLYRERLKTLVPRQVDLDFNKIVSKYDNIQQKQELKALKEKEKEEETLRKYQQETRQQGLQRSRQLHQKQNDIMDIIKEATVKVPKVPEKKVNGKSKKQILKDKEVKNVYQNIDAFEKNLKNLRAISPQSSDQIRNIDNDIESFLGESSAKRLSVRDFVKPAENKEYVGKIKERVHSDTVARQEREKRRRKVLMEQMKAHEAQQEQAREDILVKRLMKQSQIEKRIAVQLMQVRQNKSVIMQNRLEMERQYTERRLKDFDDALNREAELCRLARLEYAEEIEKNKQIHAAIAKERAEKKYQKHYDICLQITSDLIDFACKVAEYRELTEKSLPPKLVREWKALFMESKPLYDDPTMLLTEAEEEQLLIEESRQTILDEEDFNEYKNFVGEWLPTTESSLILPANNNILGFVLTRLNSILHPPTPPVEVPKFPEFPIKACVLGKYFAGKTTAVKEIAATHRIVLLDMETIVNDAMNAWKNKQSIETTSDSAETFLILKAELGEKAETCLCKGIAIPDTLLVDIMLEHVRSIPDGTGWIMDGFPSTVNQAKLLEKGLTGFDPSPSPHKSSNREKRGRKSKLANDPRPTPESKTPVSGVDVVILFDIEDNVVLKRSEGRTVDPSTGELFHEEYNKPPHGSYTGLQKKTKIQTVIDPSNDREQAQTRLVSFQENWPKLEKWFNRFDNLIKLNANQTTDVIVGELKTILDETLKKLATPVVPSEEEISKKEKLVKKEDEKVPTPQHKIEAEVDAPNEELNTPTDVSKKESNEKTDSPLKKEESKASTKKIGRKTPVNSPSATRKGGKGKEKKERSPSPIKRKESPNKSRSITPRSSKTKGGSKVQVPIEEENKEEEEEILTIEKPLSPEPGSSEWVYVEQPIDEEFVGVLMSTWEVIEATYVSSCKHIFRKIRHENETIYQYFFNTRQNFIKFLKRPDEKQEFVLQWQKDFNDFPLDMRADEDSKAELHQRVDDLCERLWDICDFRKEENESERTSVMTEGWLEDHLGLITNHFMSLMQSEVDRYQQTCKLLKDYYVAMEGGVGPKKSKLISETKTEFTRLPLIDLPPTHRKDIEVAVEDRATINNSKPSSAAAGKHPPKTPDVQLDGKAHNNITGRIPLIPRRPQSQEMSPSRNEKKKGTPRREKSGHGEFSEEKMESPAPLVDLEEKLLGEAMQSAIKVIDNQISSDLLDEDADNANHLNKINELSKVASKDKKSKKGEKKSPSKSKTQVNHASPTLQSNSSQETISEEDKISKEIQEKMRKEYKVAVEEEGNGLKTRLEAIQLHASSVVTNLKSKAQSTYTDMDNWLGMRFHQEMESIDKMCDFIRHAIENESKLQDAVILEDKEFFLDQDVHVFKTPTPPKIPPPTEIQYQDLFTCVQLNALVKQFKEVSPTGIVHRKIFHNFIIDQTKFILGGENVPSYWQSLSPEQLEEVINILSVSNEFINWKVFIVLLAYPNLETSQSQLLDALMEFKSIDQSKTGLIVKKDYDFVDIWLNEEASRYSGEYDRVHNLKQILFNMFSFETSEGDLLDYKEMLLYLISTENPIHGVILALTVILGSEIPLDFFDDFIEEANIENEISYEVTLEQFFKVLNHGMNGHGGNHRFDVHMDKTSDVKEQLIVAFDELGCKESLVLPLTTLYSHPIIRDLISACHVYQKKDVMKVFQANIAEDDIVIDT